MLLMKAATQFKAAEIFEESLFSFAMELWIPLPELLF